MRSLVRIDADRDHPVSPQAVRTMEHRGGQPELQGASHASIEPRQRRSVAGRHAVKEPHQQMGKERWSQPVTDLAPYGLRGPGAVRI
jgi:hypothetical protein